MSTVEKMKDVAAFSLQDAEVILQLARAAPLQNMAAAEQVAQVLARYISYVQAVFAPPASPAGVADGPSGGVTSGP